jgi:hypothetical protein
MSAAVSSSSSDEFMLQAEQSYCLGTDLVVPCMKACISS